MVGNAIEDVVADFGLACAALPAADRRKLPAEVTGLLLGDEHGVCRQLIHACKDGLGSKGLAEMAEELAMQKDDVLGRDERGGAELAALMHRAPWRPKGLATPKRWLNGLGGASTSLVARQTSPQ